MNAIHLENLSPENIARLKKEFAAARPFPHIAIDGFLKPEIADALFTHFPKMSEMRREYKGLNEHKAEGSSFDAYDRNFSSVIADISSPEFIRILEEITGITGLTIPSDHRGAGVHQGRNGSYLDVHIDFSVHPTLQMHRRLNLLIYLNKDWKPEYGGDIELWNADVSKLEKAYLPILNRCVIFQCSEISYHGYDKINVPDHQSRKSIYAYYYTPVGEGVKYHDTIFKARPTESAAKKIKTNLKESVKNAVKKTMVNLGMRKVFDKIE